MTQNEVAATTRQQGVQGWAKKWIPGLVDFVPALAYHLGFNLPETSSQPGADFLARPCSFLNNIHKVVESDLDL